MGAITPNPQCAPQSGESNKDIVLTGLNSINEVNPQMARDIENTRTYCEVDKMLKSFLLDYVGRPVLMTKDAAILLHSGTRPERVLPISNDSVCKNNFDSTMIRTRLESHSKADLYPAFVRAINVVHVALCKNGVHHRHTGVLNDLATVAKDVPRHERTGIAPFVALELLTKEGLAGDVKHIYAHDAESFIWVLVWVCLRYDNGRLRVHRPQALEQWLKVDMHECRYKKIYFLTCPIEDMTPGKGHKWGSSWLVAKSCLSALDRQIARASLVPRETPIDETLEEPFKALFQDPLTQLMAQFCDIFPRFQFDYDEIGSMEVGE